MTNIHTEQNLRKIKMAKKKKVNFTYAVGRRRSASARVRLHKGEGENTVNGIVVGKYFVGIGNNIWNKPFELTDTVGKYYFTAKVAGGGKNGQLDAVILGISRALTIVKPEKHKSVIKKAGLLKRDARIRERRKVGTGGKARRKRQSPKR